MVLSKLDSSISYEEFKELNKDDKDLEASLFIINVNDIPIMATIGNEKYTYVSKNILYVPLYLIYDSQVIGKIGVYEFNAASLTDLMDEDNDLDISKLGSPLLFKYVTKDYLEKYMCEDSDCEQDDGQEEEEESSDDEILEDGSEDDEEDDKEEESSDDEKKDGEKDKELGETEEDIGDGVEEKKDGEASKSLYQLQDELEGDDVILGEKTVIKELYEDDDDKIGEMETFNDAEKIKKGFRRSTNWIQKHFRNPNFTIEDNEGGGDCFFAVIRDAFQSIGKNVTVAQLRRILANEATTELFETYRFLYLSIKADYDEVNKEVNDLVKEGKKLKAQFQKEKNRDKKQILVDKNKVVVQTHKEKKAELPAIAEMLQEYRFMDGVESLDDFKHVIQTCNFWAETWAISTLERVLNIKMILLSTQAYRGGDYRGIIQCGQLNDPILQDKGVFTPKYYIMTEWLGNHYKSVLYKGNKILTFEQVPFDIKSLIVDKCLETTAGPYAIIPKFQQIKAQIAQQEALLIGATEEEELDAGEGKDKETEKKELVEDSEKTKKSAKSGKDLYNDDIVFQFYEKSANMKPGKGNGEKIPEKDIRKFTKLGKMKDWRRVLSNFHPVEFELDGLRWLSVAHYVEGLKYKKHNPELYRQFSLTSDSDISKSIPAIKSIMKNNKFDGKLIVPSSARIDSDYPDYVIESTNEAIKAKFEQNEDAKQVLRETKDAKLMQYNFRRSPTLQLALMVIRESI